MIEKIVGGRTQKVGELLKGVLLESTNKVVKDGKGYIVEDMKGQEPWYIKTRNRISDEVNSVYSMWLSGCEQLGEYIVFEVNGYMTAGNKLGGRYGIVGGSVDLGSIEFVKGKIDIINPTKSAWGENYEPYKGSLGAGIEVGLGKKSGLSLGIGYEESGIITKRPFSSDSYLGIEEKNKEKSILLGASKKKFYAEKDIQLNENTKLNTKQEHTIEIGWMVALFWSIGINVRIGYKTEVKK